MRAIKRHHFLLILFYCVLFCWLLGLYQNSPFFQQELGQGVQQIQLFINQQVNHLLGTKTTDKTTKRVAGQSSNQPAIKGSRWPQASATVYINISNPTLRNAAETAVKQWNQTGAFRFRQAKSQQAANVVISAVNEHQNGAAGLTTVSMNEANGNLIHANVQLNAGYLLNPYYGYSQQRIVNTAEHELGHAIGLQHTETVSVMQPAGSYYSIQPRDVQTVKRLYQSQPQSSNGRTGQSGTTQNYQ